MSLLEAIQTYWYPTPFEIIVITIGIYKLLTWLDRKTGRYED